ncbi:MAG TPA: hypothetical protein VGK54_07610, partial [Chloroflexota bacterium]
MKMGASRHFRWARDRVVAIGRGTVMRTMFALVLALSLMGPAGAVLAQQQGNSNGNSAQSNA